MISADPNLRSKGGSVSTTPDPIKVLFSRRAHVELGVKVNVGMLGELLS